MCLIEMQFRWDVTKWMSLQSCILWFQCIYYPLHRLFTLPLTCWAARNGPKKSKFQINFHRKQTTIYMHTRFTIYRSMYRIFASIIELLWTQIQTLCMHFHSKKIIIWSCGLAYTEYCQFRWETDRKKKRQDLHSNPNDNKQQNVFGQIFTF